MKHLKIVYGLLLPVCALTLLHCTSPPTPTSPPPVPAVTSSATLSPSPIPTTSSTPRPQTDLYEQARLDMVYRQIKGRGISDRAVLAAMRTVPRHLFVPDNWKAQAYEDHPLPIGYNQTISQPYIVAWMSELLQVDKGDKVLEIGTGSGYQAAVLGELGVKVYTVEIVEELAIQATERLVEMGYDNIAVQHRDGYYGWTDQAPFDAIIVTCAPDHVPPPLIQQLKDGGRMVIPVGPPGGYQSLFLITKQGEQVKSHNLGGVRFVPLTQ